MYKKKFKKKIKKKNSTNGQQNWKSEKISKITFNFFFEKKIIKMPGKKCSL